MVRWSRSYSGGVSEARRNHISIAKQGASQEVWSELAMSFFEQGLITHFRTCARKAGIDVGAYIDTTLPDYIDRGEVACAETCFRLLRRDPSREEIGTIMKALNRKEDTQPSDYEYLMQFRPPVRLVLVAMRKHPMRYVFYLLPSSTCGVVDPYCDQLLRGLSSRKYCSHKIYIMRHRSVSRELVEELLRYIISTKNAELFQEAAHLLRKYSVSPTIRESFVETAISCKFVYGVGVFRNWFGDDPSEEQCLAWKEDFIESPDSEIHFPEERFGVEFTDEDKRQLCRAYIDQGKGWFAVSFSDVLDVPDKEYLLGILIDEGRLYQGQQLAAQVGRVLTSDEIIRIADYYRKKNKTT